MNILHELSEQGKTVIVVTHSEEIVAQEKACSIFIITHNRRICSFGRHLL